MECRWESRSDNDLEMVDVHMFHIYISLQEGNGTRPGKRLHNYGKSQFLMGKSTINGNFQ